MAIQMSEAGPSTPPTGRQPNYKLAHSISAHAKGVTALRFSADGQALVSAGRSPTGDHKRSIKAHRAGINDISISPDSLFVASASDDKYIHIHSCTSSSSSSSQPNNKRLRRLAAHTAPVLCTAFSPKSDCLVSGSYDESAIIWDVRRGKVIRVLPAHSEAVWTVGWDREAGMVITGSADGLIRIWDAHTGQCLKTLDNDTNSPVSYAAFTPSSTYILSSTLSSALRIYNIHTSKVLKTLKAPTQFVSEKFPCPALLFPALPSDDANSDAWVVSGSENGKVVLWELSSRRVAQVLDAHQMVVVALAVSPDGRTIATGSLEPEKIIHIWHDDS